MIPPRAIVRPTHNEYFVSIQTFLLDRLRALLARSIYSSQARKMITKGLLVTSQLNQGVREYHATTGAFVEVAVSAQAFGRSARTRYRSRWQLARLGQTNLVKRYDSAAGAFIGAFASTNLAGPARIGFKRVEREVTS